MSMAAYGRGTNLYCQSSRIETSLSAKDHERKRGAGEGSTDYNLTANSPLLNRDAILKNKLNKRELSRVLSLFNLCPNVIMDS